MHFLHLSDTHIRNDYTTNSFTRPIFSDKFNPTDSFKKTLDHINRNAKETETHYEFALITGDLVHEGDPTDYQLFKSIWKEKMGDLPYFFCRGNHDRRQAFATGMAVSVNEDGDYIDQTDYQGLRIITLDSAQDGGHEGVISKRQLNQLKEWLAEPAEKGTIVLLHHPLAWEESEIKTEVPTGFEETIENSDILGIFVGHIHQGSLAYYGNKLQTMVEAISFGVDEFPNKSVFTNRTGYNSCTISEGHLSIHSVVMSPSQTVIGGCKKPVTENI